MAGAALQPLYEAHKRFVLGAQVLHADETPVAMLDPGAGKTKRAYIWAYARGEFDAQQGVIYEFCLGRGSQYPVAFLGGSQGPPSPMMQDQPPWQGTLVCDRYGGYDAVLDKRVYPQRIAAHCAAHARRKFDELLGTSEVAKEAIRSKLESAKDAIIDTDPDCHQAKALMTIKMAATSTDRLVARRVRTADCSKLRPGADDVCEPDIEPL
jgi:hypothetical protein